MGQCHVGAAAFLFAEDYIRRPLFPLLSSKFFFFAGTGNPSLSPVIEIKPFEGDQGPPFPPPIFFFLNAKRYAALPLRLDAGPQRNVAAPLFH